MPKKKNTGPNPEVYVAHGFQGKNPSNARMLNILFDIDVLYDGDFTADNKAGTISLDKFHAHAMIKPDTKLRVKGHVPMPCVAYKDGKLEAGIRLPDTTLFIPAKEAAQMTKNIRFSVKTARSVRDAIQAMIGSANKTEPEKQP